MFVPDSLRAGAAVGAIVLLLVLLAGCGDASDTEVSGPTTPSSSSSSSVEAGPGRARESSGSTSSTSSTGTAAGPAASQRSTSSSVVRGGDPAPGASGSSSTADGPSPGSTPSSTTAPDGGDSTPTPERRPIGDFGEVGIELSTRAGGTVCSCVMLADRPELRSRGLMGVTDLRGYEGMLFEFAEETTTSFYMRNTPMPLSIAFFADDGTFVSATDMDPCEDGEDCPLHGADGPFRYALEVPRGDLPSVGAGPGSRLELVGPCP